MSMIWFARLFSQRLVSRRNFAHWSRESGGADPVNPYEMLRASWTYLATGPQKILNIGPDPGPWLMAVEQFSGHRHDLWAARHGDTGNVGQVPAGARQLSLELDVWFPLHAHEQAHTITEHGFTLVAAIQFVDHLYHPYLFFRAVADALVPEGILVVTAGNVARLENLQRLLRGGGMTHDLDALIGRSDPTDPRPRVREYCWRELNNAAGRAGFDLIGRHYYEGPPNARDKIELGDRVRRAVMPFLRERGQLQSEMILIFRKRGPIEPQASGTRQRIGALLRRMRTALHEARCKLGLSRI
jgi:hypothetical protein